MTDTPPSLTFSEQEFRESYEKHAFTLRHNISNHPLLSMDALKALATRLPDHDIECNTANVDRGHHHDHPLQSEKSIEETLDNLASEQAWVGLKKVEQIPEYKALIDNILDSIESETRPFIGKSQNRQGFILITSPNSTVPFHMDPEHNFLLQISGKKLFTSFNKDNQEILGEKRIEKYYSSYRPENRKLEFKESFEQYGKTFELNENDALHVPICSPHYVQTCDDVTISFSITYGSSWAIKRESIYHLNNKLRKMKIPAIAYGQFSIIDGLKLSALRCIKGLKHLIKR